MARGILSEFGPDTSKSQVASASSGGVMKAKPLRYSEPQGPIGQGHSGPGLGGNNFGCCGSQGEHSLHTSESGEPGLQGNSRGMGSNRKG